MTDIFPLAAIPILIVMYCLFVVAMADNGVEAAQRWVCVFDETRPYCEALPQPSTAYPAGPDARPAGDTP